MALRIILLCFAAVVFGAPGARLHAQTVDLILSEEGGAYSEVKDVLTQQLAGRARWNVLTAAAADQGYKSEAQLVVTVGVKAFQVAAPLAGKTPVLGTLIPRAAYEAAARKDAGPGSRGTSAIYLDQPPARQLNLVRLVAAGREKIGLLVSSDTDPAVAGFRSAAQGRQLTVLTELVNGTDDLHPALRRLLSRSDAIVALPDSTIYNATTIVNILITTYRAQQPLFGFSPAYVKAGALAAVYSTPRQVAQEAADWGLLYSGTAPLPAPRFPRLFSVAINETVAHSLGITVDDEATVLDKLQKLEPQ